MSSYKSIYFSLAFTLLHTHGARRPHQTTSRRPVNSFRPAKPTDCDVSVVVDVASVQLCTRPTPPAVFLCSIHRYVKRISASASCLANWLCVGLWPASWVRFFKFVIFLSDSLTQFMCNDTAPNNSTSCDKTIAHPLATVFPSFASRMIAYLVIKCVK
jgi:hypothetical protein